MSTYTMLNPEDHKHLRVIATRGALFGENVNTIPVIADELRSLVIEYPVCLLKDPNTGKFSLFALSGLEPGNNLYLEGEQWNANYLPLHIRRQPFLMGITGEEGTQPNPDNTVVTIDLENDRVTKEGGIALFDEQGNATDFLKNISGILAKLFQGFPKTDAFIEALTQHDLIEQLKLTVTSPDGEQKSLQGLYNINEQKLAAMKDETLESFYSKGYIQACHMMVASLGHFQKLVNWQNNQ